MAESLPSNRYPRNWLISGTKLKKYTSCVFPEDGQK